MDRTRQALAEMAREEPELAARLVVQTLPAAAAKVPGKLTYSLSVAGVGEYTVAIDSGSAQRHRGRERRRRVQALDRRAAAWRRWRRAPARSS